MNWKKVKNQDPTKNWKYYFQNFSLLPNSSVYIYITLGTENPPQSPSDGMIRLIGRQILYQDVQEGSTLWYAEEDGGIFVCSKGEKVKLKNYDIPTSHINYNLGVGASESFVAPEGSNIGLQNLSEDDVEVSFDQEGHGKMRLTLNQVIALSFPRETRVTLYGPRNSTATVSVLTQQSIAVTQLSDENMKLLEDIVARLNLIEQNMVHKGQLEEVEKRTYWDIWSPFDTISSANTGRFTTNAFKCQVEKFRSSKVETDDILDCVVEMDFAYRDKKTGSNKNDHAFIVFRILYREVDTFELMDIYTSNSYVQKHLTSIDLERTANMESVRFVFEFDENIPAMNELRTCIRAAEHSFEISTETFTVDRTTRFEVDLYNANIHFTDDEFEAAMLDGWRYPSKVKTVNYTGVAFSLDSQTDASYKQYLFSNADFSVLLKMPLTDEVEAKYEIKQKIDKGMTVIVGLNFVPINPSKVLQYPTEPVSFDLIALSNNDQTHTDDTGTGMRTVKGTFYKHSIHKYTLIGEYLDQYVKPSNIDKYNLELVGN